MAIKRTDESPAFDPQTHLELIERSKASVSVNTVLDFGPWWYAPIVATGGAALALLGEGFGGRANLLFFAVCVASLGFLTLHEKRRRTVRPKFSGRAFWAGVAGFVAYIVELWLWSSAVSSIGHESFFPWPALLGWTTKTVLLLAVRYLCHSWLKRRKALV